MTMADNLNPLLLDAKREYSLRLAEIMSPFVTRYMDTTYAKIVKEAGQRKSLIEFQKALRLIPVWNAAIIKDMAHAITSKYPFFEDLLAAVFVTHVKVLSSIKLSSARPNIKVKLPSVDSFVHQVFIASAKTFYENVHIMQKHDHYYKEKIVGDAIDVAVRALLPLGDVLQAYLSNAVDDERKTVNPVLSPIPSDDEDEDMAARNQDDDDDDDDDDDFNENKFIPVPTPSQTHQPTDPFIPSTLPVAPPPSPTRHLEPQPSFQLPTSAEEFPSTQAYTPGPAPQQTHHVPVDPLVPVQQPVQQQTSHTHHTQNLFSDATDGGDSAFR